MTTLPDPCPSFMDVVAAHDEPSRWYSPEVCDWWGVSCTDKPILIYWRGSDYFPVSTSAHSLTNVKVVQNVFELHISHRLFVLSEAKLSYTGGGLQGDFRSYIAQNQAPSCLQDVYSFLMCNSLWCYTRQIVCCSRDVADG